MIFPVYGGTLTSRPLLDKTPSMWVGSPPSDRPPYAAHVWGAYGPAASAGDSTAAHVAPGTGNFDGITAIAVAAPPGQQRRT